MNYHDPVLLSECIEGLNIKEDGTYVDVTYGGGGHSKLILTNLGDKGRLFGFDQDEDASLNVIDDERLTFVPHNFRHMKQFLKLFAVNAVDGILADLGVSSHQLNVAERGFSYRFEAALDMRMNQNAEFQASDIINDYSAEDLQRVFSHYGELRNSKTLAQLIVEKRNQKPILNIADFLLIIEPHIRGNRNRYLAQVFQALRMEVNDETGALSDFLEAALSLLKPGGRLVVMSYHSLEDRLVKYFIKTGNCKGEAQKDFYGNINRPFKLITKKAAAPSDAEIKKNPRARSAKLRIAEKI